MGSDTSSVYSKTGGSVDLTFTTSTTETPSIRVDGTNHLYKTGETLRATIENQGLGKNNIFYKVYKNNDGIWEDIGTTSQTAITNPSNWSLPLSNYAPGSYCIYFTVQAGDRFLDTKYYFIVQENSN
jgi:hypothetical protein